MLTTMSCGIETIYNIQHLPHKKCNLSEFFTTNLKFSMLADDNENGKIFRHYQYPHNILYGSVIYLVKDENDFSNIIVYSM